MATLMPDVPEVGTARRVSCAADRSIDRGARVVGEAEGTPDSVMRIPAGLYDSTPTPVGAVFPESGVTLIEPTFVDGFDPSVWKTNVPFAGMLYENDDATVPSTALTVNP